MSNSIWRWVKRVLMLAALIGLALLVWSVWDRLLSVMEWVRRARPLPFFAVMALLPAVGVPITPFFILAGASFGTRVGLAGSALALGANLTICYWLARTLRPVLERMMRRFGYDLPDFGKKIRGAVRFTLAIKLAPGVPAFVKNYALGMAGIPFALYLLSSLLITGVYAVSLVVLGESLLVHDRSRIALVAGLVVLVALGLWWWRRSRSSSGSPRPQLSPSGI